jgi:hypothetical protein
VKLFTLAWTNLLLPSPSPREVKLLDYPSSHVGCGQCRDGSKYQCCSCLNRTGVLSASQFPGRRGDSSESFVIGGGGIHDHVHSFLAFVIFFESFDHRRSRLVHNFIIVTAFRI